MFNRAQQITALLERKRRFDADKVEALSQGVGSIAERQWKLDALELLLQAELERLQAYKT